MDVLGAAGHGGSMVIRHAQA